MNIDPTRITYHY